MEREFSTIPDFSELNEDEAFYKEYYLASKDPKTLKQFLSQVDSDNARKRKLIIPELLPDIIPYEMNDSEYFKPDSNKSVKITRHNRYTPAFLHRHDFFEIVYVYSGHCSQSIGTNRRSFTEGDIIFVAPGIYHTMEVFDDSSIVFNFLIRKSLFHTLFLGLTKGDDLQSQFFKEAMYNAHHIDYLVFHTGNVRKEECMVLYMEEESIHDRYTDQILCGLMNFLIPLVMREFQDTMESSYSVSERHQDDSFLVLNYMRESGGEITLSEVADHFGFSISYCSRLIKKTTGMSFNDWKRTIRVRRAENMLMNTSKTVAEISVELGYENTETFIRWFKKEYHMTPGQYRKANRKKS